MEGGFGIDEKIINFGVLPISKSSDTLLAFVNENLIPITIKDWNGTISSPASITIILRGCGNLNMNNLNFCNQIEPGDWILYQISVQSNVVGTFSGKFIVQTEYEEIHTPVEFTTAMGRLELDNALLHFHNCFPNSQCSLILSAHSTFLKKMKVEGISVDIPGITYAHTTTNNLPEISPNVITDIGRLFFDPKEFCLINNTECYTGLALADDNQNENKLKQNIKFYKELLNKRIEIFHQLKNSLKSISFRLTTNQIRKYEFNATVEFVWPRFVNEVIEIPTIQVGNEIIKTISINNPSDQLIILHYVLHDSKVQGYDINLPKNVLQNCPNCTLKNNGTHDDFSFVIDNQEKYNYVNPKLNTNLAIKFSAKQPGTYSTLLYIGNNLTIIEGVWITAKVVQAQFKFGNRKPGSTTPLLFEISDKHLRDCDRKSDNSDGVVIPSTKRTFTARNSGEVPIFVLGLRIGGQVCEGYGFKIIDCSPFELFPNGSRKIEIAFTPDFTLARVTQSLVIISSIGYPVKYTLLSTIPPHALGPCGKSLVRPYWESKIKTFSVFVIAFVFIIVLAGAFIDSDRVLKDHITYISRDRGPIQPTLDLRQIGLKNSLNDVVLVNNTTKFESFPGSSVKKRSTNKRNNFNNVLNDDATIPAPVTSKAKSWAAELSTKFSSVKNHVTEKMVTTAKAIAMSSKSNSVKRRSLTPPAQHKSHSSSDKKESKKSSARDQTQSEEETCSTTTDESFNSEESLSSSSDSGKSSSSSSSSSSTSSLSFPHQNNDTHHLDSSIIINDQQKMKINKMAVKKTRSLPNNYETSNKDEIIVGGTKCKLNKTNLNQNLVPDTLNNKTNITRNHASSPNNSSSDSNSGLMTTPNNSNLNYENSRENKKNNGSQRKPGKTPGRERKHALNSKRSLKSTFNLKEQEFQLNPLLAQQTYPIAPSGSIWDENRATFSYVVAQKLNNSIVNPDPAIPPCYNSNNNNGNNKRNKSHGARQCLLGKLKSISPARLGEDDEKYFDDNNDKRKPMDLGPIGTRKSPSSTPIWEPMVTSAIKKPTPLITPGLNSNAFIPFNTAPVTTQPFTNFCFDLSGNAQFYSSSNNIPNSTTTVAHQQPWDNSLLPLIQRDDTESLLNAWGSSRLWAPVDYNVPHSNSGWPQQCPTLRPPPGLSLVRDRIRDNMENNQQHLKQQEELRNNNIPQFDPFNSLSSIWSQETWNKDTNKNNNDTLKPNNNQK